MNVFEKRPLFICCTVFIFSAVVGYFFIPEIKMGICIVSFILLALATVYYIISKKRQALVLYTVSICAAISVAMLSSMSFFNIHYDRYCKTLCGSSHEFDALIISERYSDSNISGYEIRVVRADGKEADFLATLECAYVSELCPGDLVRANLTAEEYETYVNGYREKQNLVSNGSIMSLISEDEGDFETLRQNVSDIRISASDINGFFSFKLTEGIGGENGNLCSALLLGNKHKLSDNTARDFSRVGASHILALSGMHMSIIMGLFGFMLKKLRISKYVYAPILAVLAVSYLAITGFSVSATRSVIMLLAVYLSMVVSLQSDTLTSLSVAGAIILLISPEAVLDVGFWMSYSATFGIIVYMPIFNAISEALTSKIKIVPLIKAVRYVISLLAAGLCAMIPLIIVLCIFTRELSLLTLLSSIVLSLPTAATISLSLIYLPLSYTQDLGVYVKRMLDPICDFMRDFCAWGSDIEHINVSLNYDFTNIFIIAFAICLAFSLFSKFKHEWLSLIPMILCAVCFSVCIVSGISESEKSVTVNYLKCSSKSEVMLLTSGRESILLDMSNGSASSYSKATAALDTSTSDEIRGVILTDYKTAHVPTLSKLFKSEKVREIFLTEPINEDERYIMLAITERAKENNVKVSFYGTYSRSDVLSVLNGVNISVSQDTLERSVLPVTVAKISSAEESIIYASAAYTESSLAPYTEASVKDADTLIIAANGPKIKQRFGIPSDSDIREIYLPNEEAAKSFDFTRISGDTTVIIDSQSAVFNLKKASE